MFNLTKKNKQTKKRTAFRISGTPHRLGRISLQRRRMNQGYELLVEGQASLRAKYPLKFLILLDSSLFLIL